MKHLFIVGFLTLAQFTFAKDVLVRFKNSVPVEQQQAFFESHGGRYSLVSAKGNLYKWTTSGETNGTWDSRVLYTEPTKTIRLLQNPSIVQNAQAIWNAMQKKKPSLPTDGPKFADNPEIQDPGVQASGADPLLDQAWGLATIGAPASWHNLNQGENIIVAVTDSGVDYNHVDLINAMWRNPNEIPKNNIDDDKNGFVDDVVGWDFAGNDNKPYDLSATLMDILFKGGNPGHGTHVSGVIGARLNNAAGAAGVAPKVQIMAVRFINETGQGSNDDAIKAIDYAVANGASIINASWGGEKGDESDKALIEAIQRAEKKGVIFVAAAGNGRANAATGTSAGFDNDSDAKPMVPASLGLENIVAVAAVDNADNLASFSNWGNKTVKIAAPGVKILSTVPGDRFQDTIVDMGSVKATWDGTSMAAPFVSGALAAIWSKKPSRTYKEVCDTLLTNVTAVPALSGKIVSGGRLDLSKITEE